MGFQRLWFVARQEVEKRPMRADTVVACVMCRHMTQNSVSCVATPTQSFVSCVKMKKKFQLFQRLWFVSRQEVEQSPTRADTVVACVMCRHTTQNYAAKMHFGQERHWK